MSIKSIFASVFALALFAGAGMSLTATNASFVPAAYASYDSSSSDDSSSDDSSSDD